MSKVLVFVFTTFMFFSCAKKTNISYPENVKKAFITTIEIPSEVKQNEIFIAKINFMLFNPCWSFYNVEKNVSGNTINFNVNIQKNTEEICMEMIVNSTQEYELKIKKKGNYQIKYTNDKGEEIILPFQVK